MLLISQKLTNSQNSKIQTVRRHLQAMLTFASNRSNFQDKTCKIRHKRCITDRRVKIGGKQAMDTYELVRKPQQLAQFRGRHDCNTETNS